MKNGNGKNRGKWLAALGIGVISFSVLLAAAAITMAILSKFLNMDELDSFTIAYIALTAFSVLFTLAVIVTFYIVAQKLQKLVDSLNKVADGEFSTQIEYHRTDMFRNVYKNFNLMTKELGSVKSMQDDFVHTFSHEIKTPLFSIQGFANLLAEGGLSKEEEQKFLGIISEEAGRLIRLADNTLTLTRLENQQFVGERTLLKLDAEINECIIMLEREWDKKRIEICAELSPVKLTGNGAMLRQVWINLLSNAIKFTPEGGKIEVGLTAENGNAVVKIKDTGCGISVEDAQKIFQKFYRSAAAKGVEGNGLGLAICKRICTLSGGDIYVTSHLGEGSEFTVVLPLYGGA